MKRTTRKLVVRSETVRVLGALDMARVAGGDAQGLGSRTGGSGGDCAQAEFAAVGIIVVAPNR
jgi:hypothetical protein